MKIALLYTAFRQLDEIPLLKQFLDRAPTLRHACDVYYTSNNPELSEDLLRSRLEGTPCNQVYVKVLPTNAGYYWGNLQAIAATHAELAARGYDWTIKLHPDVYIVDERPILAAMRQADATGDQLVVTRQFGDAFESFSLDFCCFKPMLLPTDFFDVYKQYLDVRGDPSDEQVFCQEAARRGVRALLIPRFPGGHWHRDIDSAGLWHEHALERVGAYLKSPSARWHHTRRRVITQPVRTFRVVGTWLRDRLLGRRKESLWQRLTVV